MTTDDVLTSVSPASEWPLLAPIQERVHGDLRVHEVFLRRTSDQNVVQIRLKTFQLLLRPVRQSLVRGVKLRLILSQPVVVAPNRLIEQRARDAVWNNLFDRGIQTHSASRTIRRVKVDGIEWDIYDAEVDSLEPLFRLVAERNDCIAFLTKNRVSVDGRLDFSGQPHVSRNRGAWSWLYHNFQAGDALAFSYGEFDDREVGIAYLSSTLLGNLENDAIESN